MILDERTEFADALSVGTPNSSTVNIGDTVDSEVVRDLGQGHPVYMVITVDTAITSGGAATVAFLLVSDSTSTIATDGTATRHFESDASPVATLVAGYTQVHVLPAVNPAYERHLAFQIREVAGQALTAGAVNAFLTVDPTGWTSHADANN